MSKIFTSYLCFTLIGCFFSDFARAGFNKEKNYYSAPTTSAKNVAASGIDGNQAYVQWTNGSGSKRLVIISRDSVVSAVPQDGFNYTASAIFGSGSEIKPGQFVVFNDSYYAFTATGLIPGHTYYVAVFEYNGTNFSTEYLMTPGTGSFATLTAPTQQASGITATNITGNSMKVSWTNGNGDRRLLLVKKGAPVNANPTDLIAYSGSGAYGSGTQIGTENYAAYWSSGNSQTITNLDPGSTYYYAVFESKGFWGPVYLTSNPATASFTTLPRPTVPSSAVSFSSIEGASLYMSYTLGNGAKRIVVAREGSPVDALPVDGTSYTPKIDFGKGDAIAPGQFVVANDIYYSTQVTSLKPNTTYYFAIFEYDGSGAGTRYLTSAYASGSKSTLSPPPNGPTNIIFSNVQNNQVTLTWTKGSGDRRIIIAKEGSAVDGFPVDLKTYGGSTSMGNGNELGTKNYVIDNTTNNSVTVTNLLSNKTYHFAVVEFSGFFTPVYNNTDIAKASITTIVKPTIPAKNLAFPSVEGNTMTVSFTPGNGVKRIIIAKKGSQVTAVPADGQNYIANAAFGSGNEIAPGEFVVFNGSGNSVALTNLEPNTTYFFAVYEYSVDGASNSYLTSQYLSGSNPTVSAPTVAATNMTFVTGSNSIQVSCTPGNGSRRIFIARQGAPVDATLNDLTFYGGQNLGNGNFVLNNTSGNNATLNYLQPNTTYYFKVVEQNGFYGPLFLQTTVLTGSATTAAKPSLEPKSPLFGTVEGNNLNMQWTNGNGTRRLVIVKKGSAVTAVPVDNTEYAAKDSFGKGQEIAPGEFVVYNGDSWNTSVKNLDTSTTYYFAIFEFDGTGTNTGYLTSRFATASKTTPGAPTVSATNVLFSNIGSSSATIAWTNGNGNGRIVIARKGAPVTAVPEIFKKYSYSSNFNSFNIETGQSVIFAGESSGYSLTGLESGSTYYVAVYEYNGTYNPVYKLTSPATAALTTVGPPAIQADSVALANTGSGYADLVWKNGSGNRRLVIAKEGSPTDFIPVQNTSYTANTFFGSGQKVGNNNYVLYNGTADHFTVTNLAANKSYYFTVFEFSQFQTGPQYNITNPPGIVLLPDSYIVDTATYAGLNASITVGALAPDGSTYQWFVNDGSGFVPITNAGVYSNSTTRTLNITGATTAMNNYMYQCKVIYNNSIITTNVATLKVNPHTWTGTNNADWNTAGNWNAKVVPIADAIVIITNGVTNMPVITGVATGRKIIVGTGATLTIDGGSLKIIDSLKNNGTVNAANGTIVFNGTAAQEIPANAFSANTVKNLVIDNLSTVTNAGSLNITGVLTVSQGTLATNNKLTLKSTALGTARVAPLTTGVISGSVTVERYISSANNSAYRLLTPAVNTSGGSKPTVRENWQEGQNNFPGGVNNNAVPGYGTHITGSTSGANGFDATTVGQPSMFTYNQAAPVQAWDPIPNTNATTLDGKKGYLLYLRGDRSVDLNSNSPVYTNTTLRSTGFLLTGKQQFTNQEGDGHFSLVSNPYASPVNWNTIINDATAANGLKFENYYTYVDPNIGTRGGYVTVTDGGVKSVLTNATVEIQSGVAFFIKAKAAVSSPTFTIEETHKSTTSNADVFRSGTPEALRATLYSKATVNTRQVVDGAYIMFNNNYSKNVDGNDAEEIANFDENIAISRSGKMLSIEGRPLVDNNDTIPFAVARLKTQNYEWQFDPEGFTAPGFQAVLEDKFLDKRTPVSLSSASVIPFTVTTDAASYADDRFRVIFGPASILPVTITSVKAYQKAQGVHVEWKTATEINVEGFDVEKSVDGRQFTKVASVTAKGGSNITAAYDWFDANPITGSNYYRIKSIEKSGDVKYTEIVNVKIIKGSGDIRVYPNPVTGNTINLQLNNIEKGTYVIRLFNNNGQLMINKVIEHPGGSATQPLLVGSALANGIYRLSIQGNDQVFNQQVIKN